MVPSELCVYKIADYSTALPLFGHVEITSPLESKRIVPIGKAVWEHFCTELYLDCG